jgi:hypothetical protein
LKALHDTIKRYIAYAIPIRNSDSITLGYETFDFRHEEQPRDKIDYIAREVIGATRAWALEWTYAATLRMNAGTGKGFWNDDKLQRIGVYVPGQPHAMDALRHLLRYMTFGLKQQEIMMRLRPSSLHISGS